MFKQNPEGFKGHCGDVSTILRIAITGREQSPNLYDIFKLLGKKRLEDRLKKVLQNFN